MRHGLHMRHRRRFAKPTTGAQSLSREMCSKVLPVSFECACVSCHAAPVRPSGRHGSIRRLIRQAGQQINESKCQSQTLPLFMSVDSRISLCVKTCCCIAVDVSLHQYSHHCNDIIGMLSLACYVLAVLHKVVFAVAKQSTDQQELSASCYRPDHCVGQCICLQD